MVVLVCGVVMFALRCCLRSLRLDPLLLTDLLSSCLSGFVLTFSTITAPLMPLIDSPSARLDSEVDAGKATGDGVPGTCWHVPFDSGTRKAPKANHLGLTNSF